MTNGWDKASVALDSLVAYNTMGRRGAMAAGTATATAGPGILVKLLDVAVRIYRESGGGLQDEIAIMQGLFADMTLKGASLKSTEQCKIVALMKAMTPSKKIGGVARTSCDPMSSKT